MIIEIIKKISKGKRSISLMHMVSLVRERATFNVGCWLLSTSSCIVLIKLAPPHYIDLWMFDDRTGGLCKS